MTRFRPCIDLHHGQVKQIVGSTLGASADGQSKELKTNWSSALPPSHYASLYLDHGLEGGHVIMLGPGSETAAEEALTTWSRGLQVGGGINASNARSWIEKGASKVIITSFLFPDARFSELRLREVASALNAQKELLVLDLSCKRVVRAGSDSPAWIVAMNRWATLTDMEVNQQSIEMLEAYCSEFLIHAADVEGLCSGIDEELVQKLGEWCSIPVTYAGGASKLHDLDLVKKLSNGKVDLTIGSALDIFGGSGVTLQECVRWNSRQQ